MNVGGRYPCLFCLAPEGYELRLDKKGRPFFMCSACGCRTFTRGAVSLRGPELLWKPLHVALANGEADVARVLVKRAVEDQ